MNISFEKVNKLIRCQVGEIFNVFKDGKWHDADEISERVFLSQHAVRKVLDFLAEFDFISYDNTWDKFSFNRRRNLRFS